MVFFIYFIWIFFANAFNFPSFFLNLFWLLGRRLEKHYCLTEDSYKAVARQSSKLHLSVCQLKEAGKWRQWVHSPLLEPFLLPFFPIRSVSTLLLKFPSFFCPVVQRNDTEQCSADPRFMEKCFWTWQIPFIFRCFSSTFPFFNACCFLTSNLSNRERSH